ncbi:uncharacterized protein [Eucyclogobius newberryi]|uniref:uncharacterized protein n=1 Tax=Eucyclogobius newberryi TaxID=166745 RepID=UPI003B5C59D3
MIGPLTAFIFLSTFCQSAEEQIPVTVVQPGDNVTLHAFFERVYWYKQTPGQMMQFIAFSYYEFKTADSFKDQRFHFTIVDNQPVFTIQNIRKEDEAIYYCISIDGYGQNFMNGTFLVVDDGANSQSCVHVRQSPSSAAVAPGRSVSLQCSLQPKNNKRQIQCPQQHNVLWFRAGSEKPHTGFMYNSTNSSCVYTLSKTIERSSDTGTYYCAVDTCGHILFGTGTQVEIDVHQDPVTVALSVLLSGCVLVIIVLCVKRVCAHCRDSIRPHSELSENMGTSADVNYAAMNFSSRKVKESSKRRAEQECVYSSVRADQHR